VQIDRHRGWSARLISAVALSTVVVVVALPASSAGVTIPHLPKAPKFTSYPVTIDVAGYVDFKWTWDNRQHCVPGYAKTVNEELSFELGKPRRARVNIVEDAVAMNYATGGQAKVKATLGGFQTTNYCPPTPLAPEPPAPNCRTLRGKLGVLLTPQPKEGDSEHAALRRGVLITIQRKGKSAQTPACLSDRPKLEAVDEDQGVHVDTGPHPYGAIGVPVANAIDFWKLKRGRRISRTIKIGGGCDTITAHTSSLPSEITSCTIRGKLVVVIKRTR
jgi:hypothetical protein